MATMDRAVRAARTDSTFFPSMAVVMAVVVFIGFAPSFYLKPIFHAPPDLTALMVVHGLVFTSWMAILVAQTGFVAANRRDVHMRLGIAGAVVAALMVVLGMTLAILMLRLGFVPPNLHGISPSAFFGLPFWGILAFGTLTGIGILNRRRLVAHKRYMILSNVALLEPALARFHVAAIQALGPIAFLPLADLGIVAVVGYDLVTLRRVHPATGWSAAILLVSQVLFLAGGQTAPWHAFTAWLGAPA